MGDPHDVVEEALTSIVRLKAVVGRQTARQIDGAEPRSAIKATALTWFKKHRPQLNGFTQSPQLAELDADFRGLLEASDRSTSKSRYLAILRTVRESLVGLRGATVDAVARQAGDMSEEPPPDFSKLVPDPAMQGVLQRRWREAQLCKNAGAHLAATVMIGSLLEALLLAKVNSLPDKSAVFKAAVAPRDRMGKTLPLRDWTLRDYIEVAHELTWIRQSGRDVGAVLRDYRNYVHPAKEFAHNMTLDSADTDMFWVICGALTRNLSTRMRQWVCEFSVARRLRCPGAPAG